jgi:hypothetical protein
MCSLCRTVAESEQPDEVFIDTRRAETLFARFHEWYRFYITQAALQTDKAIEINKQIASSYERLLLIDVGAIALSISAFMSLAGKFPSHASRYPFVWLVGLAWVSLFASAILLSAAIIHTIAANAILLQTWNSLLQTYHSQVLSTSLIHLSKALTGKVRVGDEDHDVPKLFSELAAKVKEEGAAREAERLKTIGGAKSPAGRLSQVARVLMQLGFVLLCVAAIRGFFAV